MYEKLLKTVTNLGSGSVLIAGDFMLDIYVYGDALRISPEAPVPVLKVTKTDYNCGGAASVAMDLAALGATPCCLGIIGEDKNGQILKNMLTNAGVDITALTPIDQRSTTSKQRLIGLAQHRHQQQLFRMDEESDQPLTEAQQQLILELYKKKLTNCDIICLQDYNKGLLTDSLCKQMILLAKKAGKKVLVDPAIDIDYTKYAGASVITPNRTEASMATGIDIKTTADAEKAAAQLSKDFNIDTVIITLDKEGAYLKTKTQAELIPTRTRDVYDVTGAGDMVLATIAIALAADCDYKTAVQLSNITGGIEVEKFGVVSVTIEEIINEIINLNRGKKGKIRPSDILAKELDWHRKQKETIVFTNGCFDVIHRGHIEFLKFCKSQGDIVVLGINSDRSVKEIKGPERPINNQYDRSAVLAALEAIDYITIFDEPDPLNMIKQIKPDVLVKGKDWEHKGVVGREFVESYGGKVVLAPLVEGKSSTATIEKLKSFKK